MMGSHLAAEGKTLHASSSSVLLFETILENKSLVLLDFGELWNLGAQITKSSLNSLTLGDYFLCYQMFFARVIENTLCSI